MDCRVFAHLSLRHTGTQEWISHPHTPVSAAVLKVFGEKLGQSVVLGTGPQVGVIPRKLVRSHSQHGSPHDRFIRIMNSKLVEKIFRFAPSLLTSEQRPSAGPWLGHGVNEFDYCLMGKA